MKLNINEEVWDLLFVDPHSSVLKDGDIYTLGVTVPSMYTIYIANNIGGDLLRRVLSHELAHAEFAARGLVLPSYVEEVLADIIADNIVDVRSVSNYVYNNLNDYYNSRMVT